VGGRHAGTAGVTWTGGISAARYLAMTGLAVALNLAVAWAADVPVRPVLLALVLVGGLLLGVGVAWWRPRQRPAPGGTSGRGGAAARGTLAGLTGAGLILAQVLDDGSVGWVMLGLCGLMVSAAGYSWKRDGRLTHPVDAPSSVARNG